MTVDLKYPIDIDEDIINQCLPIEIPPAPEPVQSIDETGPRLMILKIESENFKSYGGLRSMGPFHKNFTCIIGPNGSGKSNVIDSMLFVFGYRAAKVRSKKLSQLIHKSELIPNATSCMVAVHFQKIIDNGTGPTDYEVVPDSHFVVTRRAYKDNSSTYWIDNTRVVYRDLANTLRQHGVDLDHNRFLILQGEVEQIALMKPKAPSEHEDGFLEYLEDIIGSSRFKQPLTIFADRIERLNDLRLEKLTRVKAVEKEKDELEGVRNEAMGYLRLVNQLTRMKNILFQQNLSKERAVEADTKERLTERQAELKKLTVDLKEKSREFEKTEAERDTLVEQHTELFKKHRDAKSKFSEFEAEDSRLRDEHAHVKASGRRITKTLQAERGKLEELERLPEETDARKQAILRQLTELEDTKKKHELAYQETVDSLAKETAPLRKKVEAAEAELAPLQTQADELTSKFALERQQFDLVMANKRREQDRANKARSAAQTASDRLKEREAEAAEAKKRLNGGDSSSGSQRRQSTTNLAVGLSAATRDLAEVRTKEAELTKDLNEKRTKLAESKSTFHADNSRGRVYNALMEAQRTGQLPGIFGRLGDLGSIPTRYDVALSTACSALDNIVTDTMDTAQKAVNFLKQHNLGLATFIGLDKMSKWTEKSKQSFNLPRGDFKVERLFDLVETVDERVRPAFYFAIRDTLVTDSMDSAVKIAFNQRQRHRVVTLQGQLIETSGAMSGGGGRPLSGRILTSLAQVRERKQSMDRGTSSTKIQETTLPDLTALERELASGDANLARIREERTRLEEFVTRLTHQKDEAERTVKRCETECARLRAEVKALTAEADRATERAKSTEPSESEQKRLEDELKKMEQTVCKKTEMADKKRATAESLKAELLDVGSARLTAVRSRLDAIEKKTKEANDNLTKLEVSVKTTARNCQKARTKITALEAELESAKTKLTEVDEKLKELEEEARVCMEAFKAIQASIEELQSNKEKIQTKLTELESELTQIRMSETSVRRIVDQLETDLSQASAKARQWQRELRALRLHRIDGESDDEANDNDVVKVDDESSVSAVQLVLKSDEPSFSDLPGANDPSALPPSQTTKERRLKPGEMQTYSQDQLVELVVNMQEMRGLEERIASMAPNMAAIEEYRRKVDTYLSRVSELNQVSDVLTAQRKHMDDAKSKRLSEFLKGFGLITGKLKEMYQMITQGGDAELELIDSLDPFSEGIVFSVRPPKKSWKNIANLSGGEKTLSSLALVFALHHYKPTPLYVMDEIDAALDFKNVSIVGNYLKERTRNAQFIVISLRNNMFELADRLCGIYKTHNITKTITLDCGHLTDELRQMVVRVATAHGREKDLQTSTQQTQQPSNQVRNQPLDPSQKGGSLEFPIKIE